MGGYLSERNFRQENFQGGKYAWHVGVTAEMPPWLTWNMLRLEKQQGSLCEDLAYASSERKRSTRGFGGSEK